MRFRSQDLLITKQEHRHLNGEAGCEQHKDGMIIFVTLQESRNYIKQQRGLLGCNAVNGGSILRFRRNISSAVRSLLPYSAGFWLDLNFYSENKGYMFLRNFGICLKCEMLQTRRS
jgi:hypothetical protein